MIDRLPPGGGLVKRESTRPHPKRALIAALAVLAGLSGCATEPEPSAAGGEPSAPETVAGSVPAFPAADLVWTESVRSPVALYESQGLAARGRLYVFGGYHNKQIEASSESLAFDPAAERWTRLAPLPAPVTHAGQALFGDDIYLAGGFLGNHPGPPTDHVWVYNTKADTWAAGPPLPEKIGGGALVQLGGRLHFFGGTVREGEFYLRDSPRHWVLDLKAGRATWAAAADLPNPRNHIGGAVLGGKLYAVGGQRLGDEVTGNRADVSAYDPDTDRWEAVADLPLPLGHISAATFAYRGRLMVVMGTTQGRKKTPEIFAYDPAVDRWDRLTSMPGARSATVAGVIAGELVLSTGTVAGGPLDTTWVGRWDED